MKKELAILIAGIFVVSSLIVLADSEGKGFNPFGVNSHARVYHGWLPYAEPYIWNTVKWSKDWTWDGWQDPDWEATDIGAWAISNLEYYFDESWAWLTWDGSDAPVGAEYKFVLTYKVMMVGDDLTAWEAYQSAGAEAIYGYYYVSGCPMFIKFQQNLKKYYWDDGLGDWVLFDDDDYIGMEPYGVGQPLFE